MKRYIWIIALIALAVAAILLIFRRDKNEPAEQESTAAETTAHETATAAVPAETYISEYQKTIDEENARIAAKTGDTGPKDWAYRCAERIYIPLNDHTYTDTTEGFSTEKMIWYYGYHDLQNTLELKESLMDYYVNAPLYARAQDNAILAGEQLMIWLVGKPTVDYTNNKSSFLVTASVAGTTTPIYFWQVEISYTEETGIVRIHELTEQEFAALDPTDMYYYTEYERICDAEGVGAIEKQGIHKEDFAGTVYNLIYDDYGNIITPGFQNGE